MSERTVMKSLSQQNSSGEQKKEQTSFNIREMIQDAEEDYMI